MSFEDKQILKKAFLESTVAILKPRVAHSLPLVASIKDVLRSFEVAHAGSVLALDDNEVMKGIFTERDLVMKYDLKTDLSQVKLPDLMSSPVQDIKPNSSIARLLHLMMIGGFRHVPIVAKLGKAHQIISVRDVLEFIHAKIVQRLHEPEDLEVVDEPIIKKFFVAHVSVLKPYKAHWLHDGARVVDAIKLFRTQKVGALIAGNDVRPVTGIFTERDLIGRVFAKELDLNSTIVRDVMTREPATITPQAQVATVFEMMVKGGYRNIPIVDEAGALTGVVSITNLMKVLTQSIVDELDGAN